MKGSVTEFHEGGTATDFADAQVLANAAIGTGHYVAVQVGSDVVVFADTDGTAGISGTDDAVTPIGKTLNDITFGNIAGT